MSVEITGNDKLDRLAHDLLDLQQRLSRELGEAAKRGSSDLEADLKKSALATLPKKGGLAQLVADSAFTTRQTSVSFTIEVNNPRGIRSMNRGVLRHPVYGNRKVWVTQRIRVGWWTTPTEKTRRKVEDEMTSTLDRLARQVGKR